MNSFLRRMSWQSRRKGPSTSGEKQTTSSYQEDVDPSPIPTPKTQTVLLLLAAKQPYQLTEKYAVPKLEGEHEVLVRTEAIGLNPIDWKAPVSFISRHRLIASFLSCATNRTQLNKDFNFAIPTLPYISGRELAGEVVQKPNHTNTRLKSRDRVRPP